jgi:hypothetical protein
MCSRSQRAPSDVPSESLLQRQIDPPIAIASISALAPVGLIAKNMSLHNQDVLPRDYADLTQW